MRRKNQSLKNETNNDRELQPIALYGENRRAGRMRLAGICMFFFCLLTCLFAGFTFFPQNSAGENLSSITAEAAAADDWQTAVEASVANKDTRTVRLTSDMVATAGSFGGSTTAFTGGALYVPSGAKIILDLNNKKIDRGLGTSARGAGYVIYVAGELTIKDSTVTNGTYSTNGMITGGCNSSQYSAGGIHVYNGGKLTMESGRITANRETYTYGVGGVWLESSTTCTMSGGSIAGNIAVS
ncbi:MAG: hypothetical protein K2L87_04235, partial [Clostridiales bacterium]|nr:hypothetical protein [Clostridiales bacterium]